MGGAIEAANLAGPPIGDPLRNATASISASKCLGTDDARLVQRVTSRLPGPYPVKQTKRFAYDFGLAWSVHAGPGKESKSLKLFG